MSYPYRKDPVEGKPAISLAEMGAEDRVIETLMDTTQFSGPWTREGELVFRRFATKPTDPSVECVYKVFHLVDGAEHFLAESEPKSNPWDAAHDLSEVVYYATPRKNPHLFPGHLDAVI
ncbi:hypothetical protein SLS58_006123 [Diplodia intermedia]|uniref:Uncharacterized protein n=1 Tax=Diplodia intermedia TaxID=856260 RepID=A0ABR3TP20_9PEZI